MVSIAGNAVANPDAHGIRILGTGVIVMMALLPMVRSAGLIFASQARSIIPVTLMLEAALSVIMLMGRVRWQRQRMEYRLATTLTRAVRAGVWRQ